MDRIITASEANQRFSELLRDVQAGDSFVVTSHGRSVARVIPIDESARHQKISELLDYLKTLPHRTVDNWKREDLYD